jgi:hypothetical protein
MHGIQNIKKEEKFYVENIIYIYYYSLLLLNRCKQTSESAGE